MGAVLLSVVYAILTRTKITRMIRIGLPGLVMAAGFALFMRLDVPMFLVGH
ncbi:hypothetical protein [Methanogenium sp. MK-MG]|uniref:hypothetical protein n=1 Tax=Methanogenium sp. MK-MG TaxID=2599926 RepID=UPI0013EC2D9D|nr:hypothetical protein [Methanogenium sp. MK-MG]KAF1073846.1 hypothetical protein MKMG_02061 [Methanogenium sp. MK-MG]